MPQSFVIDNKFFTHFGITCDLCNLVIPAKTQKKNLSYYTKCICCEKFRCFHNSCFYDYIKMTTKLKTTKDINLQIHKIQKNFRTLENHVCKFRRSRYFICDQTHTMENKNVTLYKCPSCNQNPISTCFVIKKIGKGKNNITGCAQM